MVIFLFGSEAHLHKRFQGPVLCCLVPPVNGRLLLAIIETKLVSTASTATKPVYYSLLSTAWVPRENTVHLTCRHSYSLAQSSYIMSLGVTYVTYPS